jgi:hypothetical protein
VAVCTCGEERPSTAPWLFGYEFRGAGSPAADHSCRHCGYHRLAHDPEYTKGNVSTTTVVEDGICPGFEARGPWEMDTYYCGHGGWD